MKSRIMPVLLALLLSVFMTACSNGTVSGTTPGAGIPAGAPSPAASADTPSPSPAGADAPAAETTPSQNHSVLEAYRAVLQNDAAFFSVDNKKEALLNDFLTNKELYSAVFQAARFAVLDMDGDTVPEVVLELTVDSYPEFYEVLHAADGAVRGYNIVYRGLEGLKADGTFRYSGGAADNGYGRLKFREDACETEILGYTESSQANGGMTVSYFVNEEAVTEEAFASFSNEQDGKPDAVWHVFSQGNIETELS